MSQITPEKRILAEFRGSAIPDRLTQLNVQYVEGDTAVQILAEEAIAQVQKVTSYATRPATQILNRYQFAVEGGWVAYGTNVEGTESGKVAHFKPFKPRQELNNGRVKAIKYETPGKCEALPILPWVDEESARAIYQRYGIIPLQGEAFWQVVKRYNLPIAICEGLKKALALIAHGIPAIAVRGITCWHRKGTGELHEAIAYFATAARKIYVIFDQDEKPTTQRDVRRQILKLGNALALLKCHVYVPIWDSELGKGIDDVLFAQGEMAQIWLDALLQAAPSLKVYQTDMRIAAALATIAYLNALSYPVERETTGEYLSELPDLEVGKIHVLTASMNAGKTTRIGQDWVKDAIAQGWNVLVLSPLNSLGQQTANDWGLPHIHDFGTSPEQQDVLWRTVSAAHGIVLCPDSLHRLPHGFWQRPVLLVKDEANQVIDHLCQGDTLGSRWSNILERVSTAANHAIQTGAIVLSEDGLPNRAVNFIKTITGSESVRVFRHHKQGIPWDCVMFSGQASGYRSRLIQAVQRGDRILYMTSSQVEGKRLERALFKAVPIAKIVRIDSETNQEGNFNSFFNHPDDWLQTEQPDVLILSPSAKSGISIEGGISAENAYFNAVWGYFPSLATDTHLQLLGRYRPSVPRFIFVPPFVLTSGNESLLNPRAIKRRLNLNLKAIAGVYGLEELLQDDDRSETRLKIETAVLDYLAAAKTVSGAQKSIAYHALTQQLEQAGHTVQCEKLGTDTATVTLWKEVQEELWREDANEIASATVDPQKHTLAWAQATLESLEATRKNRILAQKILWREEFPDVLFDDSEECYQSLCKDYGSMRRGVLLQARAENLEATKRSDRAAVESILSAGVRAIHRLPKTYAQAWNIAKTGILELLNGQTYNNLDPRAIAVKQAALHYANEIDYWLRLQIKPEQTPVEICNKLLKKLGLKGVAIARPGKRGQQKDRVYQVTGSDDPIRQQLLEAARRKLSISVSTICNKEYPITQIMDTEKSSLSCCLDDWFTVESLEDIYQMWQSTTSLEAQAEMRRLIPPHVLSLAIENRQDEQTNQSISCARTMRSTIRQAQDAPYSGLSLLG